VTPGRGLALLAGALLLGRASALEIPPPQLQIRGSTDGSADLRLAAGATFAPGDWDLTPRLTYRISSQDGFGNLFSRQGSGGGSTPRPWEIGATFSLRVAVPPLAVPAAEHAAALQSAYRRCAASCESPAIPPQDEEFCDWRREQVSRNRREWLWRATARDAAAPPSPEAFCPSAVDAMRQFEVASKRGEVAEATAHRARSKALEDCLAPCFPESIAPPSDRAWCAGRFPDLPAEVPPPSVHYRQLCPDGRWVLDELQKRHPETVSRYPTALVNLGARLGGATYPHLAPDPAAPGQLAPATTEARPWSLGASGTYLPSRGGRGLSLEGLATWSWEYQAAPDTARWCVPAGSVTQPGGAVPAQTCAETAAAPPARDHQARAALYLGYLDQAVERRPDRAIDAWRIAVGYEGARAAGGRLRSTIALPVLVSFAGGKGDYQGLARIAPSVAFGGAAGSNATVWAISIALLGQRTMFSEDFDRL
jgi:hypothetical protein